MHPSAREIDDLIKECEFRRQRRSGPGGQHRNKVETGVFIKHLPTGIEAAATEERRQSKNRTVAIDRLRVKLAIEHRSPPASVDDHLATPSALWKSRCHGGRISISRKHADFATLLAELLDGLDHFQGDFVVATGHFECTRSQLLKLICVERAALAEFNRQRIGRGERPLSPR